MKRIWILALLASLALWFGMGCSQAKTIDEQMQAARNAMDLFKESGTEAWIVVDVPLEAGVRNETTFGSGGKIFALVHVNPAEVADVYTKPKD